MDREFWMCSKCTELVGLGDPHSCDPTPAAPPPCPNCGRLEHWHSEALKGYEVRDQLAAEKEKLHHLLASTEQQRDQAREQARLASVDQAKTEAELNEARDEVEAERRLRKMMTEQAQAEVARLKDSLQQRRDISTRLRNALERIAENDAAYGRPFDIARQALAAQAPGDFLSRRLPGSHEGCNYLAGPDAVCNKCGKYVPPEPAQAQGAKATREQVEEWAKRRDALLAVAKAAEQVASFGSGREPLRKALAALRTTGWEG